jgi:hypothetical protein
VTRPLALALSLSFAFSFSRVAHAQAEPAPEEYVPPSQRGLPNQYSHEPINFHLPDDQPKWRIAVAPRLAIRLGDAPDGTPLVGPGGGVQIHRALVALGHTLRFGLGFDFGYDRVFHDTDTGTQQLAHATFAAVLVFDALVGPGQRVRPFFAAGGGLSVGNYEAPVAVGQKAESLIEALGLVHLSLGFAVRTWQSLELGLHAETNLTFSSTSVGMPPVQIFQPGFVEVALDIGFRF